MFLLDATSLAERYDAGGNNDVVKCFCMQPGGVEIKDNAGQISGSVLVVYWKHTHTHTYARAHSQTHKDGSQAGSVLLYGSPVRNEHMEESSCFQLLERTFSRASCCVPLWNKRLHPGASFTGHLGERTKIKKKRKKKSSDSPLQFSYAQQRALHAANLHADQTEKKKTMKKAAV